MPPLPGAAPVTGVPVAAAASAASEDEPVVEGSGALDVVERKLEGSHKLLRDAALRWVHTFTSERHPRATRRARARAFVSGGHRARRRRHSHRACATRVPRPPQRVSRGTRCPGTRHVTHHSKAHDVGGT
eukprot:7154887-Prymnesium_polylepis.1